jgi:hypothetical protein
MTRTQQGPIVKRFQTLGGATVIVTKETPDPYDSRFDHTWSCECGHIRMDGTSLYRCTLGTAREEANKHAGECRAMPL